MKISRTPTPSLTWDDICMFVFTLFRMTDISRLRILECCASRFRHFSICQVSSLERWQSSPHDRGEACVCQGEINSALFDHRASHKPPNAPVHGRYERECTSREGNPRACVVLLEGARRGDTAMR